MKGQLVTLLRLLTKTVDGGLTDTGHRAVKSAKRRGTLNKPYLVQGLEN